MTAETNQSEYCAYIEAYGNFRQEKPKATTEELQGFHDTHRPKTMQRYIVVPLTVKYPLTEPSVDVII